MSASVLFSEEQQIGFIHLNRPDALNAVNLEMIEALQQQLQRWQADDDIHAVVVQALGDKAFCAGGDVRWLYEAGRAKNPEQLHFFWQEYRLNYYLAQFTKPYIALMNGLTMGGGVGISLHGSHPIGSEYFSFAMPETGIGFFPDIGASYLLARCPGASGLYLGLTGNRIAAEETLALGLIKYVVPSDHFPALIENLKDYDLSINAFEKVDTCIRNWSLSSLKNGALAADMEAINSCFEKDSVEEIFKALETRADEWGAKTLALLKQKAPLSLKVTLAQLRKAKNSSLAACIKMDYELVQHFMKASDFYEGVRALLIDKDKKPYWQPSELMLISDSEVAAYFNYTNPPLVFN